MSRNIKIRNYAREKDVPLWKIADRMKISQATLYIKLRYPLLQIEEDNILDIIDELGGDTNGL